MPTPILQFKTPYELFFHQSPDYTTLRAFGCLCYASIHPSDKLAAHAIQCVFIGYLHLQKGYKLLRLDTKAIIVSRHVRFQEHHFPYHSPSTSKSKSVQYTPANAFDFVTWLTHGSSTVPTTESTTKSTTESPTESANINDTLVPSDTFQPAVSHDYISDNDVYLEEDTESTGIGDTLHNSTIIQDHPVEVPSTVPCLRTSHRPRTRPTWWTDYNVTVPTSTVNLKTVDSQALIVHNDSTSHPVEPKHYYEAIADPRWIEAMDKELIALESNNTWVLTDLPSGKKCVGCRWVYKIKTLPNGQVERYKARLVAKGYTQAEGIDYHDTFAPVVKLVTVRTLLAVAVAKNWHIEQLDVNNAFLHGDLREEVYMRPPLGYKLPPGSKLVCKLIKSLYGLRQASREWFAKLTASLLAAGYKQSHSDHSLFTFTDGDKFIAVVVYVDDVLLAGNDMPLIQHLKQLLHSQFTNQGSGSSQVLSGLRSYPKYHWNAVVPTKVYLGFTEACWHDRL